MYGANLIGSAAGSLASLLLLGVFGGEGVVVVAATLAAVAGLLFASAEAPSSREPRHLLLTALSAALVLLGLLALIRPPAALEQQLSPYKTLSVLSQSLDARHTLTLSDAAARVDVVESSTIHVMPGLSLLAPAALPPQAGLMLDGDNLMPITGLSPDSEQARALAGALPNGLLYRLRPNGRTLVIEAGTGTDVLFALAGGAEAVTAVEENALVIETVRDRFDAFTDGLYSDPRVEVVNQSGRVFRQRAEVHPGALRRGHSGADRSAPSGDIRRL